MAFFSPLNVDHVNDQDLNDDICNVSVLSALKKHLPDKYQCILTSATITDDMSALKALFMTGPVLTLKLKVGFSSSFASMFVFVLYVLYELPNLKLVWHSRNGDSRALLYRFCVHMRVRVDHVRLSLNFSIVESICRAAKLVTVMLNGFIG